MVKKVSLGLSLALGLVALVGFVCVWWYNRAMDRELGQTVSRRPRTPPPGADASR